MRKELSLPLLLNVALAGILYPYLLPDLERDRLLRANACADPRGGGARAPQSRYCADPSQRSEHSRLDLPFPSVAFRGHQQW
mmetsp:Transcript_21070/g.57843  ORF Transcript_21070/g.57843 Transcript_21070/m.57843 type:complete len:82 (+) Transcript_21070:277-522(+)